MSAPIRAADGCMIGTKYNRYDTIPFWLKTGDTIKEEIRSCERHVRMRYETEIKTPWGRTIGELVKQERGSTYLELLLHKDRNYFYGKDVFCREHNEWHHWGLS